MPGRSSRPGGRRGPAILLALLVLLLPACRRGGESAADGRPEPAPLLVIGLDGADPGVLRDLTAGGRLPVLAGLIEEGWCGRLATSRPTISPLVWNTMATGKSWLRLGIDLEGMKRGFAGGVRPVPAPVWRIASRSGKRVALLNWWLTWPAEEVDGYIFSDRAGEALFEPPEGKGRQRLTHPPEWIEALADLRRPRAAPEEIAAAFGLPPGSATALAATAGVEEVEEHQARDEIVLHATLRVFEEERPDLTVLIVRGLDVTQHAFWPENGGAEEAARSAVIAGAYGYYDRKVGELVQAFRRREGAVRVLIVSDHGMRPRSEVVAPQAFPNLDPRVLLGLLGVARIEVAGRRFQVRPAEVHLFARELFFRVEEEGARGEEERGAGVGGGGTERTSEPPPPAGGGSPAGGRTPESPGTAAGKEGLSSASGGARETGIPGGAPPKQGAVESDGPRQRAVEMLVAALAGARTADGKPLFLQPRPAEGLPWCQVRAEVNPRLQRRDQLGREEGLVPLSALDNTRMQPVGIPPGQHYFAPDGVFIAAGREIVGGGSLEAPAALGVADVGPTILRFLGLPPARDMDGHPFARLWTGGSGAAPAVEVASYDHLRPQGIEELEGGLAEPSPEDRRQAEEFRTLGYIQ